MPILIKSNDVRRGRKTKVRHGRLRAAQASIDILGDPGATSRDDAIFLGESLLQELKSPWELILIEPVSEVLEFRSADWAEKYFSAQSAMRSSRVTLSPSYTK